MNKKIKIKSKQNYRSISNRDTPFNLKKLKKKYINEQMIKSLRPKYGSYSKNTQDEVNYAEEQVENYTISSTNYTNSTIKSALNKHSQNSSILYDGINQRQSSDPILETKLKNKHSNPIYRIEYQKTKIKQNLEIQKIYQKQYYIKKKNNYTKTNKKLHRKRSNQEFKVPNYSTSDYSITFRGLSKEDLIKMSKQNFVRDNIIKQGNLNRPKNIKSKQTSYIKQKETIPNKIKEHKIVQTRMKNNYKKNVELKSAKRRHAISKTEKAKKIGTIIFTKAKSGALKSILAVGCSLVVIIVLIIVMISAFLQSSIGFLFADDSVDYEIGDISIGEARDILEQELDEKVEEIKSDVNYDKLLIYAMEPNWKDILSIYAVLGSNRENIDVTSMKEENLEFLRKVFWECCEIEWGTSTYTVKHVYTLDGERVEEYEDRTKLEITLKKTWLDEMAGKYSLSNKEHEQLMELQKPEYQEMWAKLLAVG